MFDKLKKFAETAKTTASSTAVLIGDLNGDGKVDEEDARIAANWAKKKAGQVGNEAAKIGKEAVHSDMAKDAAAGAAIGAAIAIPIPVIGPAFGAVVGAGLGVYKNLTKKGSPAIASTQVLDRPALITDLHAELIKLEDLRIKQILTDDEFLIEKKRLLGHKT